MNLSSNLTATVKTRYGPSRQITRENGGRQGSRLVGRLFGKQMDTLCEQFLENDQGYEIRNDFKIGCLEFVDDALSCALGINNQKATLEKVDEFVRINELEWGETKCQVILVGN